MYLVEGERIESPKFWRWRLTFSIICRLLWLFYVTMNAGIWRLDRMVPSVSIASLRSSSRPICTCTLSYLLICSSPTSFVELQSTYVAFWYKGNWEIYNPICVPCAMWPIRQDRHFLPYVWHCVSSTLDFSTDHVPISKRNEEEIALNTSALTCSAFFIHLHPSLLYVISCKYFCRK